MTQIETVDDVAFERLVAAASGNAKALITLADKARQSGKVPRSLELAKAAVTLDPANPEIAAKARSMLARTVPTWHFPMMIDEPRNQAFQRAIERAVRPGIKVLDIGSGSGLLAMMAARAGADEVHSCEVNPIIAEVAAEIVERNGFADRITVHPKISTKLDPESDLGGPADLVVSEIIGKDLVGEKVLPSMRDAAKRLAKPDARFIPSSGDIRVALAHYARAEARRVGTSCGFDLSPFGRLAPSRMNVRPGDPNLTVRGDQASLFSFDLSGRTAPEQRSSIDLAATGGTVNGVVQWFRLQLDEIEVFENGPEDRGSQSWRMIFFPFEEAVDLAPGEQVRVEASIADDRLLVWRA